MSKQKIFLYVALLQSVSIMYYTQSNNITLKGVIPAVTHKAFGEWSIDKELFDFIRNILPEGKTIVEMGSGWASGELSKYYTVYSIEHDRKWLNKYDTNYIFAPIKDRWYDVDIVENNLPKEYDLILVDGPPGHIGRGGFLSHLNIFKTDIIIIFDDVNRHNDYNLMVGVAEKLNREFTIHGSGNKKFGVIMPN